MAFPMPRSKSTPSSRRIKHVALIVESAVAPRRNMLSGVSRYMQEHEPWAVYLKPNGVEKSLPDWLRDWRGDGIIAAVNDPASFVVMQHGVPVVDVVGVLQNERVPLVHTNDRSVGRAGAEHLLERGFRPFGFATCSGSFFVPVSRFHSSKVWFVILPSTNSCANLRR